MTENKPATDLLSQIRHQSRSAKILTEALDMAGHEIESRLNTDPSSKPKELQTKLKLLQSDVQSYISTSKALLNKTSKNEENPAISLPKSTSSAGSSTFASDAAFLAELAQQLLEENKDLQELTNQKGSEIEALKEKERKLRDRLAESDIMIKQVSTRESDLADQQWAMELKVQELQQEKHSLSQELARLRKENQSIQTSIDTQIDAFEEYRTKEELAKEQQEKRISNLAAELLHISESRDRILTDNESLSNVISQLEHDLESSKSEISQLKNKLLEPIPESDQDSDESDRQITPIHSPQMSPIKGTPAKNHTLESETLKTSLSHAHKLISHLKAALHKEKLEKIALKASLESGNDNSGQNLRKSTHSQASQKGSQHYAQRPQGSATVNELIIPDPEWENYDEYEPALAPPKFALPSSKTSLSGTISSNNDTKKSRLLGEADKIESPNSSQDDEYLIRNNQLFASAVKKRNSVSSLLSHSPGSSFDYNHGNSVVQGSPLNKDTSKLSNHTLLSPETLKEIAAEHGLVVIPEDEYKSVANKQLTQQDIESFATVHELILVPKNDYAEMIEKMQDKPMTMEELGYIAWKEGCTIVTSEEFDKLSKESTQLRSVDGIVSAAAELDQVVLSKDTYTDMIHRPSIYNPTEEEYCDYAKNFDRIAIKIAEYEELQSRPHEANLDAEKLKQFAETENLELISKDELRGMIPIEELNETIEKLPVEKLSALAFKHSYSLIPSDELQKLRDRPAIDDPMKEEYIEYAKNFKLKPIGIAEYKSLKTAQSRLGSLEALKETASKFDSVLLPRATHEQLIERSQQVPQTAEDLVKIAASYGKRLVTAEEYAIVQNPLAAATLKDCIQKLKENGHTALSMSQYEELAYRPAIMDPSFEELSSYCASKGYELVIEPRPKAVDTTTDTQSVEENYEKVELSDMIEALDKSQLIDLVERKGLKILDQSQYESLLLRSENSKPEEQIEASSKRLTSLIEEAAAQQQIVLSEKEYLRLKETERKAGVNFVLTARNTEGSLTSKEDCDIANNLGSVSPLVLSRAAQKLGYGLIPLHVSAIDSPQSQYSELPHSEPSDVETNGQISSLRVAAANMGYTVMSNKEFLDMQANSVIKPLSREELERTAKSFGLVTMPESVYETLKHSQGNQATPRWKPTATNLSEEEISTPPRQASSNHTGADRKSELSTSGTVTKSAHSAIMHATPVRIQAYRSTTGRILSPVQISGEEFEAQKQSVATFDENMIEFINQTMSGEYLYKEEKSIMSHLGRESRHKRFFQLDPFNLVIRWSRSEQGLADPSRTKSLQIISVYPMEDNCVNPPGLYHRLLVLQSAEGSMKVSFPSSSRYVAWYEVIKYLVGRNPEGVKGAEAIMRLSTPERTKVESMTTPRSARRSLYEMFTPGKSKKGSQKARSSRIETMKSPISQQSGVLPPHSVSGGRSMRISHYMDLADAGQMDDVRKCCGGKHDVSTLRHK
ncbi:hypothetical protein CANCADRAFT_144281 [Tortispora caseinolytica NRRL Y-17796]|uniref:Pleckstrin homology domain-containing protein n=1 Tax=Tortispora caseinolytica NRRL Y-17796 TaxID=767744 RepID=A0A1E4TDH5_9ASCO|nr:hypothetical protein CANCADRAFT_144281 [Tortispora caseinolytica NRRL Y-17796]